MGSPHRPVPALSFALGVLLTVGTAAAQVERDTIVVLPDDDLVARGVSPGPFQPDQTLFLLYNTTDASLEWTATTEASWLVLSRTAGTAEPGSRTPIVVSIAPDAGETLAPGRHDTTVEFRDTTNDSTRVRNVRLEVAERAKLDVTPPQGRLATYTRGGAAPEALALAVSNAGSEAIAWRVSTDVPWLRATVAAGELAGQQQKELEAVPVVEELATLPIGWHTAVLRFENLTSGVGNTTRELRLLVRGETGLVLAGELPDVVDGSGAPEHDLTVRNAGTEPLAWSVRSSAPWLDSDSGGTLQPGDEAPIRLTIDSDRAADLEAGRHRAALVVVNETDGVGTTSRWITLEREAGDDLDASIVAEESATSVESFGIRWTFDRPYPVGRFATGDWWVAGPVVLVGIDPPSLSSENRVMNGAMLDPSPRQKNLQGYDSALNLGAKAYRPELNVAVDVSPTNPLVIQTGASLVSVISLPDPGVRPQLETAAILTILDRPAPAGSFRPPYSGSDKRVRFDTSDLDTSRLGRLASVGSAPSFADAEAWFERPWIDHTPGWSGSFTRARDNMPNYGREIADQYGTASLLLQLDVPDETKHALLVRLVQVGIDYFGVVEDGGTSNWFGAGGWASGRKWPILFAGLVLGDQAMTNIGQREVSFGEDTQTFFVEETPPGSGQINGGHGGYGPEHVGLPEWGSKHSYDPASDRAGWMDQPYRLCCTANAWWAQLMAAYVMGARELWNHEALFEYQDRYLEENTRRGIADWRLAWSSFGLSMWQAYRAQY